MTSSQSSSAVSTSSISSMMGGMVDEGVVIFITHQSALVVRVLWGTALIIVPYITFDYMLATSSVFIFIFLNLADIIFLCRQKLVPLWKYTLKFPNLMASGRVPCHMLHGDVCHSHLVRPLVCVNEGLIISSCCCF